MKLTANDIYEDMMPYVLFVGYRKDRECALIKVINTTYNEGVVEYHLGEILSHEK